MRCLAPAQLVSRTGLADPLCHRLLQPRNSVLKALGDKYRFELAVGINGRAWVSVPEGDEANMVAIIKALQEQKAPSKAKKEEQ